MKIDESDRVGETGVAQKSKKGERFHYGRFCIGLPHLHGIRCAVSPEFCRAN